jgi:putative glutamine amidotransferase
MISEECEMTTKPLIGLTPLVDIERESYWMLPGYMELLEEAGAVPVMLPITDEPASIRRIAEKMDGILITGGHDVALWVYGALPEADNVKPCPERDRMELILIREALKADKPIFGICRGLQILNTALGGTLWQDLPTQHPSSIKHVQEEDYDTPSHAVSLPEGSFLKDLLGQNEIRVNSFHHQAIKDLAPALKASAYSPDGLIEAVEMPGKRFVKAVQWHPEFAFRKDMNCRKIAAQFVKACCEE